MPTRKSTGLANRKRTEIDKKDVNRANYKEQIKSIERQGRIAAWNDYIGFCVSKILGLGGLTVGGIEWLDPNILPIVLNSPELIAGVGLALLTGKSIITLIAKVERALGGRQ